MKRLPITAYYGWISNDPNVWGFWSVHYAEWVELREDSKKITLSKWTSDNQYLWPLTTLVTAYNIVSNQYFIRTHIDGNITSSIEKNVFAWVTTWNKVVNLWESLYNTWSITTPVWKYGFIFWETTLYKWVFNATSDSLWIYNTSWILSQPEFNSTGSWIIWANWSFVWWEAVHTPWSAATLEQTFSTTTSQVYRVKVVCWTITADSCQIRLWGIAQYTFNSSDSWLTKVFTYTATWTSTLLEFAPFSWFDGSFKSCEVYVYNITEQSQTFNEKSPYITINNFIYVGNGSVRTEIDTTTSTWVFTDVLTIDLDYTIKWFTKVWDQVFIYASNGDNSRQYLWNGVDTTVSNTITWADKNIVNVASFINQDYVITKSAFSNKTGLYLVNGYSLEKLFENTSNNDNTKERIYFNAEYTNAIETIGNRLLVPWIDWIYTYGKHSPWYPNALVKEYLHQTGQTTAMYYSETSEYELRNASIGTYSGLEWVWETVINFYNQSYPTIPYFTGFVVLQPMYGEVFSNVKNFEKLVTGYTLWTGCQINYYSKDERDIMYANIAYNYTILPTVGDTYSLNGNTFTITQITDLWDYCILHTTYTGTWDLDNKGTFTRISWTWDSSIISNRIRYGFKYIWTITDTTSFKGVVKDPSEFNKKYIGFELLNTNISFNTNTPEIYDTNLYFTEKTDE